MPYGNDDSYSSLTLDSSFVATENTTTPGVNGYVFDLFQADVSLSVDPSFAAALLPSGGFTGVDAVATFDASAEVFNNLFFITVDSSDISDDNNTDVIFSIDGNSLIYPFVEKVGGVDTSMSFSNASVKYGAVNSQYIDQSLKKDMVRHIAKSVTGGYAVADIFSNESDLLADVEGRDASLHDVLHNSIDTLKNVSSGYTVDQINSTTITDADQLRFFQVAQALYGINVNDTGTGGRQESLYADLSANSVDSSTGEAKATVTVPIKFKIGDAIALRIQYDPNSGPVGGDTNGDGIGLGGMGNNLITSRSYKILIRLS